MVRILVGDCRQRLEELPDESAQLCVTSPPYFALRDYGVDGQLGLEPTPDEYIDNLVGVFGEVRRTLKDTGALVLNLGDSYSSSASNQQRGSSTSTLSGLAPDAGMGRCSKGGDLPAKNLMGIPWRVALALQANGWFLRSAMVWIKGNSMPESVQDRPTTAHEHVFLLAKSARYYWDAEAIRVGNQVYHRKAGGYDTSRGIGEGTGGQDGRRALGFKERDVTTVGRNYRTSDLFNASLDLTIEQQRAYLAHLEYVRDNGGLILDENGDPVALKVNTAGFSGAHFAVMPNALVEPFVKAGTSERGECPECGAAWERVTKSQWIKDQNGLGIGTETKDLQEHRRGRTSSMRTGGRNVQHTTGWQPTCQCNAGSPVPQTVLDPFGGAGTTGLVADRLQRNAILYELNPDYAEMSRERLIADGGMFVDVRLE